MTRPFYLFLPYLLPRHHLSALSFSLVAANPLPILSLIKLPILVTRKYFPLPILCLPVSFRFKEPDERVLIAEEVDLNMTRW